MNIFTGRLNKAALFIEFTDMRLFIYLLLAGVFPVICGCNNQTSTAGNEKDKVSNRTGLDIEPLLTKTDSLQILYFDDPYGDSIRYTRYFRYTSATDSGIVNSIIQEFDTLCHETDTLDKGCRSEGKMIAFVGPEPVKTLYFSTGTFDQCKAYIYFIKDGKFYYLNLSQGTAGVLNELKKKSKKP